MPSRPCPAALALALALPALAALLLAAPANAQPDPAYWRLAEVESQLAQWQQAHPDLVHVGVLGTSGQGRPIPMVTVSDHAAAREAEPRLLFFAAQHANEPLGTGAIMRQIAALLAGYGEDPDVTARVNGLELVFVPVLNPDAHLYVFSPGEHWQDWRKTMRDNDQDQEADFPGDGVDTNRNWDWFWDDYDDVDGPESQKYKGPFPFSEPEVVALRDWVLEYRPLLVLDYHSPVTISWTDYIFWPWYSQHGHGYSPDEPVARDLAEGWADHTQTLAGGSFRDIYAYDTLPKAQNWIYGTCGILSFVMEIGEQCWYAGADVDTIAARVARGSTWLVDRALDGPGIRGRVTGAPGDVPLAAEVQIAEMHQDFVGPRLCDPVSGHFQRLTRPGTFTLTVSCEGYQPQTRTVTVGAGWAVADVTLEPVVTGVDDPGTGDPGGDPGPAAAASWLRGDRRVHGGATVRLALPAGLAPARSELFDVRGRRLGVLGRGLAAGREHTLRLPARLAGGVYLLRTTAGAQGQVARLICVE
jgi:hypothetical protein